MKKRFNSTDVNQKHGNELSKKLYRTITDQSKRLDDARSCARNIADLFSPNLVILRRKLCEYCERLIFSDPVLFGRKGEELLWRKVFYDIVSTAKKLRKGNYTQEEVFNLQNHIYAGIGFYHHMISKLQTTFNIGLPNVIDFPVECIKGEQNGELVIDNNIKWAEQALHQCLMYLGDLSRYKLEISSNSDVSLPIRYYMQAISYKPEYGMPHNQMGTLAMNQDYHLDAVYHYMRCLACKYSFEGTSSNLISLFEKNSKYLEQLPQQKDNAECSILPSKSDNIKRFLARFLLLIDIWYFNKNVPKVYNLCHLTFKDLDECLTYCKTSSESGDTPTDVDSFESEVTNLPSYLSSDILFKVSVICLLCISKLQANNSQQVSTVTAFTLAVYSQLIQNITNHIQVSVLKYPLAEIDLTTRKKLKCRNKIKLRRRKLMKGEDSDSSDDDLSISSSDQSFMSDPEDLLARSSEDEMGASDTVNCISATNEIEDSQEESKEKDGSEIDMKQKQEVIEKVKKMDVNDMIEIISEENLLQSIKILNDWLMIDSSILKSCGMNTRSLLRQITYLLNLVNLNISEKELTGINLNLSDVDYVTKKIPLPEDIILRGLDFLSNSQTTLDWNIVSKKTLSVKEDAVIRIVKLRAFGKYLISIPEAGVSFDEKEKLYVCKTEEKDVEQLGVGELVIQDQTETPVINGKIKEDSSATSNNSKGGQLIKMKHMGQLWLASEVNALESRVRGKASLSPYLVLDADALIKYTFMVKYLVHSRKFIVLVPNAVVSALDDLKREKPEARDAIRWLETQFHRGNRFFRSQRPQERASIPFIKYPKKKDKEMFTYIQIIECCYYLSEQQKGATNVVTLLIGNHNLLSNGENKEFSYVGLAQTAGITIESITQFYAKSKKSSKENR